MPLSPTLQRLNQQAERLETDWTTWWDKANLQNQDNSLFLVSFRKSLVSLQADLEKHQTQVLEEQETIREIQISLKWVGDQWEKTRLVVMQQPLPKAAKAAKPAATQATKAEAQGFLELFKDSNAFDKKTRFVHAELYKRAHPLPPAKPKPAPKKSFR
jgi:hypothetical protein